MFELCGVTEYAKRHSDNIEAVVQQALPPCLRYEVAKVFRVVIGNANDLSLPFIVALLLTQDALLHSAGGWLAYGTVQTTQGLSEYPYNLPWMSMSVKTAGDGGLADWLRHMK